MSKSLDIYFFFFNDTATTEIYTLSLHDALPICDEAAVVDGEPEARWPRRDLGAVQEIQAATVAGRRLNLLYGAQVASRRSEEHTSELQSQSNLVCRLLLEKKKNMNLLT